MVIAIGWFNNRKGGIRCCFFLGGRFWVYIVLWVIDIFFGCKDLGVLGRGSWKMYNLFWAFFVCFKLQNSNLCCFLVCFWEHFFNHLSTKRRAKNQLQAIYFCWFVSSKARLSTGVATSPGSLKVHPKTPRKRQRFGTKMCCQPPWGRFFGEEKNAILEPTYTTTTTTTTSTIILYFRQGSVVGITPFWQSSLLFKEDSHMSNGTTVAWTLIWTSETRVLLSCWVVVAASTVPVNGGVQWELIRDVVVQVIWPSSDRSGLPAVPAAPWQPPQPKCACSSSLKLMTQVAMETVSVKIRVFHPNR